MDTQSQMSRSHDDQGSYNAGLHAEGEDHTEKKSVLKKVKAKARKIKDSLIHGHGHNPDQEGYNMQQAPDDHDLDEEENDEKDEQVLDAPQVHVFDSAAINTSSVPGQLERSDDTEVNYGKSKPVKDDYSGDFHGKFDPSPAGLKQNKGIGIDIGRTSNISESPESPANTPASITSGIVEQTKPYDLVGSLTRDQEVIRGQPEINTGTPMELEEDPVAPKSRPEDYDPSNYETKVADPTGSRGEEIIITPIISSFDKMKVTSEKPRAEENFPTRQLDESVFPTGSHDQFSPEPTPPIPLSSESKNHPISDAPDVNHPISDASQRNRFVVESTDVPKQGSTYPLSDTLESNRSVAESTDPKQGSSYPKSDASESNPSVAESADVPKQGSTYTEKISSATSAIADGAISAKNIVASKLGYNKEDENAMEHAGEGQKEVKPTSPVEYGKKIAATVTQKLSPVYGKVAETGTTMMSKVPGIRGSTGNEGENNVNGQDKGVSFKDYLSEKLKPGDEHKALAEVISETLNKQEGGETKMEEKPMGKVTESEEVKRRLGSSEVYLDNNSAHVPGGNMVDKVKGVVGSMFGKGVENQSSQQQQPQEAGSFVGAVGEGTEERRLQESGN